MFQTNIILCAAVLLGLGAWYINELRGEIKELSNTNETLLIANNAISKAWMSERNESQAQINVLAKAQNEIKSEIRYVDKIKYKIIKENNGSCVSSINDVFRRLREQKGSANSASRE